jgi:hypothetical protein
MKNIILVLLCFLCFACSEKYYSSEINTVLFMAGDNRSELEKVLNHYSQNLGDSLKLRAAEFLILNMSGKYSEYYDAPWENVATASLRWTSSSNKQLIVDTYGLGKIIVEEDLKFITAKYLINNIELAFKVWQEQPWGKHITFGIFCEEILPYRISSEPLENWREKALASFADINHSFRNNPDITAVEACIKVNSLLPKFKPDKDFPVMNYSMLMASTRGACDDLSALAAFTMRALGIPVTIDFTPKWLYQNVGHSWNVVCDSSGKHIPFMGTEESPGTLHQGITAIKSKVYRRTFANRHIIETETVDENIPPVFQQNIIDVSSEYGEFADIEIPLRFPAAENTGYAYLASLGVNQWHIAAYGLVEEQKVRFSSAGTKVVYLPVYYSENIQTPANYPFWLSEDEKINFFEPDTTHLEKIILSDVTIFFNGQISTSDLWCKRMLHGVFEGANCSDFSDATTLYTIKELPKMRYNTVTLNTKDHFRYVRYLSPDEGYCNVRTPDVL